MRFPTLAAMTMLASFTAIGSMVPAAAQPSPPPAIGPGDDNRGPGSQRPGMHGPAAMMDPMRRPPFDPSMFALMYRPDDRKLTPPDGQKIAEAILLWFGNRTWKVTEVGPAGDGQIKFAYATADGSTIARFTMDTKTGRVVRTG